MAAVTELNSGYEEISEDLIVEADFQAVRSCLT